VKQRCSLFGFHKTKKAMETIILQQTDPAVLEVATLALNEHFNVISFEQFPDRLGHLILTHSPRLVVMDFILKGQDALSNLSQIRSTHKPLNVVALSCNNDISSLATFVGFDGYIEKPFDLDVLVDRVKHFACSFSKKVPV
jgi:DNA-binding response OmpR family regulator